MTQIPPTRFRVDDGQPLGGAAAALTAAAIRAMAANPVWRFNPWTGTLRYGSDVKSDPHGLLIQPPREPLVNALGQPAPGRTDFTTWRRDTLEQFARQVADENLVLRDDLKNALAAWRQAVANKPERMKV